MKFEEVLPAFKEGYSIRHVSWPKEYVVYMKDGYIYDQEGCMCCIHYSGMMDWLLTDGWKIVAKHKVEEPEPDWDYIIKNKCLCWFWSRDSEEAVFRYLIGVDSRKKYPYKDEFCSTWKHCRPVRKNELNFYEDRKENSNEI